MGFEMLLAWIQGYGWTNEGKERDFQIVDAATQKERESKDRLVRWLRKVAEEDDRNVTYLLAYLKYKL